MGFNGGERRVVETMDGLDSSRDVEVCVSVRWGRDGAWTGRVMAGLCHCVKKVLGDGVTA